MSDRFAGNEGRFEGTIPVEGPEYQRVRELVDQHDDLVVVNRRLADLSTPFIRDEQVFCPYYERMGQVPTVLRFRRSRLGTIQDVGFARRRLRRIKRVACQILRCAGACNLANVQCRAVG